MDGTPIYDVKPYVPYADCPSRRRLGGFADRTCKDCRAGGGYSRTDAAGGGAGGEAGRRSRRRAGPGSAPGYRRGDGRRFGVRFAGMDVRFTVADGQLTVCEIVRE